MKPADVIVIGAGIAGASAACELARTRRVVLLERESQPGYHTTGRSAAMYTQNYGNRQIRALTLASQAFLAGPGDDFGAHPLLGARGAMFIAREDQLALVAPALRKAQALVASIREVGGAEALALNPLLDPAYVAAAIFEPDAMDIDVHALHGGFLRRFRHRGGEVVTSADVQALTRDAGLWTALTAAGCWQAPLIVNAAGAWCDAVARLAGVAPIGLEPKRRTVITFDAPERVPLDTIPLVIDIEEKFYFKPESGAILASPADETPSPPCDARPEEIDVAIAADRFHKATGIEVRRIRGKWAGLRSFVADKTPVVGFDDRAEGFFWLAGQGGYGIQTSPAIARCVGALLAGGDLPEDIRGLGLSQGELSVKRLRARPEHAG